MSAVDIVISHRLSADGPVSLCFVTFIQGQFSSKSEEIAGVLRSRL